MSLNVCIIQGRLTRDPELRRTGSGLAVASFCVAVERDFPNKETGEKETDFIDCVAWRQTGEFVSKYFQKGSLIVVSGRLQIRNWTDKDGNKRKTAEIVADNVYFGGSKKDNTESASTVSGPYTTTQNTYSGPWMYGGVKPAVTDFALLDDDDAQLPF
jgi:single-strand DNA-binding protein